MLFVEKAVLFVPYPSPQSTTVVYKRFTPTTQYTRFGSCSFAQFMAAAILFIHAALPSYFFTNFSSRPSLFPRILLAHQREVFIRNYER
jgi:hypothetical protein